VTTPADWRLAEAFLLLGETDTPLGRQVRELLHTVNNQLTPIQGYASLLEREVEGAEKPTAYLKNLQKATDQCLESNATLQKLLRGIFVKKNDAFTRH
jgi:hypothetical protein